MSTKQGWSLFRTSCSVTDTILNWFPLIIYLIVLCFGFYLTLVSTHCKDISAVFIHTFDSIKLFVISHVDKCLANRS